MEKEGISLICACKNRTEALKVSLASWACFKQIKEIIIVDWNSDTPIQYDLPFYPNVKIIRVENQKYFNQPQPLNLALSFCSYDTILKVDCDYIFNPYLGYNFFEKHLIDDYCFVCGDKTETTIEDKVKPYYIYLRGFLYIKKKFLEKIGGWNENYKEYYGGEDEEIENRLVKYGLEKKYISLDYTLIHIPHSSKERITNFEGNNNPELKSHIRNLFLQQCGAQGIPIETEVQWSWEYNLGSMANYQAYYNVLNNKTQDYYIKSNTQWEVKEISFQRYTAQIK